MLFKLVLFVNKIEFYFINFIIEFAVIFNGLNIKIIKSFFIKQADALT